MKARLQHSSAIRRRNDYARHKVASALARFEALEVQAQTANEAHQLVDLLEHQLFDAAQRGCVGLPRGAALQTWKREFIQDVMLDTLKESPWYLAPARRVVAIAITNPAFPIGWCADVPFSRMVHAYESLAFNPAVPFLFATQHTPLLRVCSLFYSSFTMVRDIVDDLRWSEFTQNVVYAIIVKHVLPLAFPTGTSTPLPDPRHQRFHVVSQYTRRVRTWLRDNRRRMLRDRNGRYVYDDLIYACLVNESADLRAPSYWCDALSMLLRQGMDGHIRLETVEDVSCLMGYLRACRDLADHLGRPMPLHPLAMVLEQEPLVSQAPLVRVAPS